LTCGVCYSGYVSTVVQIEKRFLSVWRNNFLQVSETVPDEFGFVTVSIYDFIKHSLNIILERKQNATGQTVPSLQMPAFSIEFVNLAPRFGCDFEKNVPEFGKKGFDATNFIFVRYTRNI